MILQDSFTLANGVKIPKLGLGTWMIEEAQAPEAIAAAVKLGYRHFDTAQGYGNEKGVGAGMRNCGLNRDELFVTTKMDAFIRTYEGAKAGINKSLQDLGLDYIDLFIIHSPQPWTDFHSGEHYFAENLEIWQALEEAYQEGKVRAIGVSNFEQADLDNLLEHGQIKPMVNQILAHISNTPLELIKYCQDKNILVEAYSPVAHGEMLKNQTLATLAHKYNVTVAQLCIRYCLELGLLPLPKTKNPQHMQENAQVDFALSAADVTTLKNIAPIANYGEFSHFPVFGGKMHQDGSYES